MKDKLLNILGVLVLIAIVILAFIYNAWQFDICYPEVSDNWWYCFQHAWGGG